MEGRQIASPLLAGQAMAAPTVDEETFIELVNKLGATRTAKKLNITERSVRTRRRSIEKRRNIRIDIPDELKKHSTTPEFENIPGRIQHNVANGVVLVGGDLHVWTGETALIFEALVQFARDLKPKLVIMNGDAVDMCSVSRHPRIGWEHQPTVQQEIEATQDALHCLAKAVGKAPKVWPLGNHDMRFETFIATRAPEFAKVHGVHLRDHFPLWEPCWSCWINEDVVVKHRYKGGVHAAYNNVKESGVSIVTNHLHRGEVRPYTDFRGTRYGVDTGMLSKPFGNQFQYLEDNRRDWRSSFAVLTFVNGKLMYPELVFEWDDTHVQFRGELIKVRK